LLLRFAREVGRHARKHALDLRLGPLVAGHDPHDRLRPCGDLIDVTGSNLGLHHEFVGTGHDLHDDLGVADHATDGMHSQLVDNARLRCP
jgi:hypothetical protein